MRRYIPISVSVSVSVEDLCSELGDRDALNFIKAFDEYRADWGFTESCYKYFADQMKVKEEEEKEGYD